MSNNRAERSFVIATAAQLHALIDALVEKEVISLKEIAVHLDTHAEVDSYIQLVAGDK